MNELFTKKPSFPKLRNVVLCVFKNVLLDHVHNGTICLLSSFDVFKEDFVIVPSCANAQGRQSKSSLQKACANFTWPNLRNRYRYFLFWQYPIEVMYFSIRYLQFFFCFAKNGYSTACCIYCQDTPVPHVDMNEPFGYVDISSCNKQ